MASEQILKRAFFGGFKRENVIDYIEKLQIQLSDAQKKADYMQNKCKALSKNSDKLNECQNEISTLISENSSLKAEVEKCRQSIDSFNSLLSSNQSVLDGIQKIITESEQSRKNAEELIEKSSQSAKAKKDQSDLIVNLSSSVNNLLNTLNEISGFFKGDESQDDNQFRFDIDGLAKVEEEYLNKMFIAE